MSEIFKNGTLTAQSVSSLETPLQGVTLSSPFNYASIQYRQEDPVTYKEDLILPIVVGKAEQCNPEDVTSLYRKHWSCIRTNFQTTKKDKAHLQFPFAISRYTRTYELGRTDFSWKDIGIQSKCFLCFLLRHVETCELQYYYASNNTKLFIEPILVINRENFQKFIDRLFQVYNLRSHPIGGEMTPKLPSFIIKNPSLLSLERNKRTRKRFDDHLCLF